KQLTLIQHKGVKSFNKVLRQVDSAAARDEISNNDLDFKTPIPFCPHDSKKSYHSFSERIINMLKFFLDRA
ncbi:hypothetical protein HAX54_012054, partial [Datura stramonium]|nr:hypothetical protein [Datura stramonium]